MLIIALIFALYLGLMVWIGFRCYNRTDTMSEYILGGRKLGSWVTALSAQAADMSGWLLIGLPGTAYLVYTGTTEAIWTAIGLVLGTYCNWLFTAKRLRSFTEVSGNSLTLPDFFENRFRDTKHILRVISGFFIVIFFLVYTSSQFAAGGKLFSSIFGIDYMAGMIIGAVIILLYSAMGGFSAVCWTDSIQGAIMFFALIIVPFVVLGEVGGWETMMERLSAITPESLTFLPENADGSVNSVILASGLGWGLGYFGQPHILVRFMAIESPEMIRKSRIIAMVWVITTLAAAVFIGIVGRAYMPDLADPETIFMELIYVLFSPVLAGILLTAILAAIMSTASAQLLVTASSVSRDLYATLLKKDPDADNMVWVSRLTVVIVAIVGIIIAFNPDSSVFDLVSFAWSGFGAAFGPLIMFALFWRRMTREGAIAGLLAGGISDIIWYVMSGGIFDIYEIIPGFAIGSLAIILVSLMTKPQQEILDEFDSVKEHGKAMEA